DESARRRVRVRHEREVRALWPRREERPVAREPLRLEPRALNVCEALVEDVTRRRRANQPAFGDERAREDREDVVGTVADQNAVRIDAQHAPRGLTESVTERLRVLAEAVRRESGPNGVEHARAGRV